MKTLARYVEVIVDPTFDDFHGNSGSFRHAYLACVAIFHAVDRAAEENGVRSASLRPRCGVQGTWSSNWWMSLRTISKHVQSSDEKIPSNRPGLPIGLALGFDDAGESMDLRNLYFVIRDAVRFFHKKAGTTHPRLP